MKVSELLLTSRPNDEILRHGNFIMDVSDFGTLACERYVYGFTIDVISLKLLARSSPTSVIYLPSFSQMWAKRGTEFLRHKVPPLFAHCSIENATCILTPVHFATPQH